jgi:hypothetical protein
LADLNLYILLHENEAQKKTLQCLREENLNMKNHLLKTIKQLNKNQYLKKIEFFQSEFIQQDLIIDIFRTDQAQLLQSITLEKNENIKRSASRDNKFLKFRKEFRKYELAFIALKFKFYTFLQNIRDND